LKPRITSIFLKSTWYNGWSSASSSATITNFLPSCGPHPSYQNLTVSI
jgi:hypothetical protein